MRSSTSTTLDDAIRFNNLGVEYYNKKDWPNALSNFQKVLEIVERLKPGTLDVATSYRNIANVFYEQKKFIEALAYCQKELEIKERLVPDSLDIADSYMQIAHIYCSQGKGLDALPLYEKAFRIQERDLPPAHADLIAVSSNIAVIALKLEKYDFALRYIDIAISKDPTNKNFSAIHHDIKGCIFHKQGQIDEALKSFDQALLFEENYTAAENHRAAVISNEKAVLEALCFAKVFLKRGSDFYEAGKFLDSLNQYKVSLGIHEHFMPNSLILTKSYNGIGKIYQSQGKLNEALLHYQKALAIQERLVPDTLDISETYNNAGLIYYAQGNLIEAFLNYEKSLNIRERLAPNTKNVVTSLNNIGLVYHDQGRLTEALSCYEKAMVIQEKNKFNDLDSATTYNNIGMLYYTLGKLTEALKCYEKCLTLQEGIAPNSLNVSILYTNIAEIYKTKDESIKAFEYYQKVLAIQERLVPNSLYISSTYSNLGVFYHRQLKFDEAMQYYQKSLVIREREAPNSLDLALSYSNIGVLFYDLSKFTESLGLLEKSFCIKAKYLIPKHPDLILLSNNIAYTAFLLGKYDVALRYADISISKDPNCKSAHNTRGRILQKVGRLDEALQSFDAALACDTGYADAALHRAEVLKEIAKLTGDFGNVTEALSQAQKIEKTDYDQKLKARYEAEAKAAKQDTKVELPKPEYEAGDQKFLAKLAEMQKEIEKLKERVTIVEEKIETLESRMSILDKKVYDLEHSMTIIHDSLQKIDEQLKNNPNSNDMADLLLERKKIVEREKEIKRFNQNPDLADYYHALLSEISAAYIVAQVISTEKIEMKTSSNYQKAASAVNTLVALIPVVGSLATQLITGIATVADSAQNAKDKNALLRIRLVAPTTQEFDKIALRIAVQLTLENEKTIVALKQAMVPSDWKTRVLSLIDGMDELITSFIADNDTLAKLLGRKEGQAVITHLQAPRVAENYRFAEETGESGSPYRKSRNSVIAHSIFEERRKQVQAQTQKQTAPSTSAPLAGAIDLVELIKRCKNYSSTTLAKIVAIQELRDFLEKRAAGAISSDVVLTHVTKHLNMFNNPIFAAMPFKKSDVKSLFNDCKTALEADLFSAKQMGMK